MPQKFTLITPPQAQDKAPGQGVPEDYTGWGRLDGTHPHIPGAGPHILAVDQGSASRVSIGYLLAVNQDYLVALNNGLVTASLTQAEIDALSSPPAGLMVYNSDMQQFQLRGESWSFVKNSFPDGAELSGTYDGDVYVSGAASLAGDTTVKGSLFVAGKFLNQGGYALEVNGDLTTIGSFNFTPTDDEVTQKDVTINGNFFMGQQPDHHYSDSVSVVSYIYDNLYDAYFLTVGTNLYSLGYRNDQPPFAEFLTGDLAEQRFQFEFKSPQASNGTKLMLQGLGETTPQTGDTLRADYVSYEDCQMKTNYRDDYSAPGIMIRGSWIFMNEQLFDGSGKAGACGLNLTVHGDIIGFENIDLSGGDDGIDPWNAGPGGNVFIYGSVTAVNGFGTIDVSGGNTSREGVGSGWGGEVEILGNCNTGVLSTGGDSTGVGGYCEAGGNITIHGDVTLKNASIRVSGGACSSSDLTVAGGNSGRVIIKGDYHATDTAQGVFAVGGDRSGDNLSGTPGSTSGGRGGDIFIWGNVTGDAVIHTRGGNCTMNQNAPCGGGHAGNVFIGGNLLTSYGIFASGGDASVGSPAGTGGGNGGGVTVNGDVWCGQDLKAWGGAHAGTGNGGNGGTMYLRGAVLMGTNIDIRGGDAADGTGGSAGQATLNNGGVLGDVFIKDGASTSEEPTNEGGLSLAGSCMIKNLEMTDREGLKIKGMNLAPATLKIGTLVGKDVLTNDAGDTDSASIATWLDDSLFTYAPGTGSWFRHQGTEI